MVKKRGPKGVHLGKDGIPLQTRGEGGKFVKTPPPETLLKKLDKAARQRNLDRFSSESYKWFRGKVRTFGGQNVRNTLLKDAQSLKQTRKRPTPGFMYTYVYDAKHKDTLPYFDAFPLIFMVGPAKGGFYGINLHYLPPKARALLMDELLKIVNNTRYNNRTKLGLSYDVLSSTKGLKAFGPCFKHYLFKQVKSPLAQIPASEWEAALFMPSASFKGASNSKVWSDSIQGIN